MTGTSRRYTIDARVFLNAFNPAETGHAVSSDFLAAIRQRSIPVVIPSLLFPKVAATIVRMRGDADLARSFTSTLRLWPQMVVIPLDDALSNGAVEAAVEHHLRDSDVVYGALAIRSAPHSTMSRHPERAMQ